MLVVVRSRDGGEVVDAASAVAVESGGDVVLLTTAMIVQSGTNIDLLIDADSEQWQSCDVVSVVELPDVQQTLDELLRVDWSDWQWPDHASSLAVLRVSCDVPVRPLHGLPPALGDDVEVVSSPFGVASPRSFVNSIAKGVVSNRIGSSLFLTDARLLPGSEGGAVLDVRDRRLCGVVLGGLVHRRHPNVCLSVCVDVASVYRCVFNSSSRGGDEPQQEEAAGSKLSPPVVMVRQGTSWASGVVIGRDLVVTNAHVIAHRGRVTVRDAAGVWHKTQVVYTRVRGPWDVALLRVLGGQAVLPAPAVVATDGVREGDPVDVVGFALFSTLTEPSVTRGHVSRVVSVRGRPVIVQTTADVHWGNSGGALLDMQGRVVGVVTSNMKFSKGEGGEASMIPKLNFSVPSWVVMELREGRFRALEADDQAIDDMWQLRNKEKKKKKRRVSRL